MRVLPHPDPLYRIEGEPGRLAEGMYDKMGALGAHEVVVETPNHDKRMSQFSDEEIERVLWVWAARIADLKKDSRFKYVAVFKNQGGSPVTSGPTRHSQITATIFVPGASSTNSTPLASGTTSANVASSATSSARTKSNGKRIVDVQGEYYALCPYASRVPYEMWLHAPQTQSFV